MSPKLAALVKLLQYFDDDNAPLVGNTITCRFAQEQTTTQVRVLAMRQRFMQLFLVATLDGNLMGVATQSSHPKEGETGFVCAEGKAVPDDIDEGSLSTLLVQLGLC